MLGPTWSGAGTYSDGETEDYLLEIADDVTAINMVKPELMIPLKVSPNPAKDLLMIEYSLRDECDVTLDLLDPEGRVLKVLEEGMMNKGTHHLAVDASSVNNKTNSGFFFVRVTAKGKPAVYKKVVIIR
jgi:hypothetical protein